MTKEQIFDALSPSWWIASTPNSWSTVFYSTIIEFTAGATTWATYLSSAPFQTFGLNAGISPASGDVTDFINALRTEAAQRLFDMHCSAVTGHTEMSSVFNATA
jgi:hypothetical protein